MTHTAFYKSIIILYICILKVTRSFVELKKTINIQSPTNIY